MGLSFSVPRTAAVPPSLKNIYKEAGIECQHGDLTAWAQQGVLLLNALLTVEESKPMSHKSFGWETFTDAVLTVINDSREGVIFLLWGAAAQAKGAKIDTDRHTVLKAAHPSPLSAYRGFFGCHHFALANEILRSRGDAEIDWNPDA